LRNTLYFKDDDARLSFLYGNYITLTNLTEYDIERIIKHKMRVNVSVHTTNPDLRVKLMGNPKAGEALKTLYRFAEAGIPMNCQLVLCPEINDGGELVRSLRDLTVLPTVESIACVPVGLTKFHRRGLRCYTKEEAVEIIETVKPFSNVYCADEFYLKGQVPIPDYEFYGDFPQYENGVGMSAYMKHHFKGIKTSQNVSIATGVAAFPLIKELVGSSAKVYEIRNDFFGENITVSGLLTARDIIAQLRGEDLGELLLLPPNVFNADAITLDDFTAEQIGEALGVKIKVVDFT
jgi:putative radical SAM enzyme (TIGR03279 family)